MKRFMTFICLAALLPACNMNLVGGDNSAAGLNTQPLVNPPYSGFLNPWFIFDDTLHHGGDMALWGDYWKIVPNGNDISSSSRGTSSLSFLYDSAQPVPAGAPPAGGWYGVAFTAPSPVDISGAGFTTCRFWAKASTTTLSDFQAQGIAINPTLTTTWTEYTIPLPAPASQNAVAWYFLIGLPAVDPVTIYVDDISYEK